MARWSIEILVQWMELDGYRNDCSYSRCLHRVVWTGHCRPLHDHRPHSRPTVAKCSRWFVRHWRDRQFFSVGVPVSNQPVLRTSPAELESHGARHISVRVHQRGDADIFFCGYDNVVFFVV